MLHVLNQVWLPSFRCSGRLESPAPESLQPQIRWLCRGDPRTFILLTITISTTITLMLITVITISIVIMSSLYRPRT